MGVCTPVRAPQQLLLLMATLRNSLHSSEDRGISHSPQFPSSDSHPGHPHPALLACLASGDMLLSSFLHLPPPPVHGGDLPRPLCAQTHPPRAWRAVGGISCAAPLHQRLLQRPAVFGAAGSPVAEWVTARSRQKVSGPSGYCSVYSEV